MDLKGATPKRRVISENICLKKLTLDFSKDWSIVNEPTLKGREVSPRFKQFELELKQIEDELEAKKLS